jgi:hypothetical protein
VLARRTIGGRRRFTVAERAMRQSPPSRIGPERPIEVIGGADQRQMGERLREIA